MVVKIIVIKDTEVKGFCFKNFEELFFSNKMKAYFVALAEEDVMQSKNAKTPVHYSSRNVVNTLIYNLRSNCKQSFHLLNTEKCEQPNITNGLKHQ